MWKKVCKLLTVALTDYLYQYYIYGENFPTQALYNV